MNKETKKHIGLGVCAITAVFLMYRQHKIDNAPAVNAGDEIGEPSLNDQFAAPYFSQTPGIFDSPVILNGGNTFNNVNNVSVTASSAHLLTEQYIPLFGFVGVAAYSPDQSNSPPSLPAPAQFNQPVYNPAVAPARLPVAPNRTFKAPSPPTPQQMFNGNAGMNSEYAQINALYGG